MAGKGHEVLLSEDLSRRFVKQDIVKVHNDGGAMLNTVETFGIFQHNLYWSLPVSIRSFSEATMVSLAATE